MNRTNFSVEIIITKDGKEKIFNVPFLCDNQVWLQLFEAERLGYTFEIPIANVRLPS
jgi:hypothetical protein